ncbi:MAG: InlB B-repeat-containing protein [Anaerovoracaceae bacterium]
MKIADIAAPEIPIADGSISGRTNNMVPNVGKSVTSKEKIEVTYNYIQPSYERGNSTYLTAVLVDEDNVIQYYGLVDRLPSGTSNVIARNSSFNIPETAIPLKLMFAVEQINGDNKTDFCNLVNAPAVSNPLQVDVWDIPVDGTGIVNGSSTKLSATTGKDYVTKILGGAGYYWPAASTIKVRFNGSATDAVQGTQYTYNETTGVLTIPSNIITGSVTSIAILGTCRVGIPVIYELSNATKVTNTGPAIITAFGTEYLARFTPNGVGNFLPNQIQVYKGEELQTESESTYLWEGSTGYLSIADAMTTTDTQFLRIVVSAVKTPVIGGISLQAKPKDGELLQLKSPDSINYQEDGWDDTKGDPHWEISKTTNLSSNPDNWDRFDPSTAVVQSSYHGKWLRYVANNSLGQGSSNVVEIILSVSLKVTSSPGGQVVGVPSNEYVDSGSKMSLIAMPESGFKFAGWTENGVLIPAAAWYSFAVKQSTILIASFIEDNSSGDYRRPSFGDADKGDVVYLGSYPQNKYIGSQPTGTVTKTQMTDSNSSDGYKYRYVGTTIAGTVAQGGAGFFRYDPVKWRVLETSAGRVWLMSDKPIDTKKWHRDAIAGVNYSSSDLRKWLNGGGTYSNPDYAQKANADSSLSGNNFIDSAFSPSEKLALSATAVVNNNGGTRSTPDPVGLSGRTGYPGYPNEGADTNDKIFPMAYSEAFNPALFKNEASRVKGSSEYAYALGANGITEASNWTRSPGGGNSVALVVGATGTMLSTTSFAATNITVKPTMNLDLSKVIMSSAAVGTGIGAKPTPSTTVKEMKPATGDKKLTVIDNNLKIDSITANTIANVSYISWSGASYGSNCYLSALLTDRTNGKILYYAAIKQLLLSSDSAGTSLEIILPDAYNPGTMELKFMVERRNPDYMTDYACAPVLAKKPGGGGGGFADPNPGTADTNDILVFGTYPTSSVDTGTASSLGLQASPSDGTETVAGDNNSYRFMKTPINNIPGSSYWFRYDGIKWRVLSKSAGKIWFIADQPLDFMPWSSSAGFNQTWANSDARAFLNGTAAGGKAYSFMEKAFTAREKMAVLSTSVNNNSMGADTADKVYLLSSAEASDTALFGTDTNRKKDSTDYALAMGIPRASGGATWWLRTPSSMTNNMDAMRVSANVGNIEPSGYIGGNGIRPVMNLDLSEVLMTNSALSGKSGVSSNLKKVTKPTGNKKLTLIDYDLCLTSTTLSKNPSAGDVITVRYAGANKTGGKYFICAAVINSSDASMLYYGAIKSLSAATDNNGTAQFAVPYDFDSSKHRVQIFIEERNGDNRTDYAGVPGYPSYENKASDQLPAGEVLVFGEYPQSKPIDVPADLPIGEHLNDYTSESTKEKFRFTAGTHDYEGQSGYYSEGGNFYKWDPIRWKVINISGGKLWLVSEKGIDSTKWSYNGATPNISWGNSDLRAFLNEPKTVISKTPYSFINTAFNSNERASIQPTATMPGYMDKVYVLSPSELMDTANFANENARSSVPSDYAYSLGSYKSPLAPGYGLNWLRTAGIDSHSAGIINEMGAIDSKRVDSSNVLVRPTMQIDLSTVLLTTQANGAKSGQIGENVGKSLSAYALPSGVEKKFTIKDKSLNLRKVNWSGDPIKSDDFIVNYEGAATGKGYYLSAIINAKLSGAILYYGAIKTLADPGDANGAGTIEIPNDFDPGTMELMVFVEKRNGDSKTDLAGEPAIIAEVGAPVIGTLATPTNAVIGEAFNITEPFVSWGKLPQTNSGWQITKTASYPSAESDWINYAQGQVLTNSDNNKYIRFYAASGAETVYSNYVLIALKVRVSASSTPIEGGIVSGIPADGLVDYNKPVTYKANASNGFSFIKWIDKDNANAVLQPVPNESYTVSFFKNTNLEAQFAANSCNVKVTTSGGNGKIYGGGNFLFGTPTAVTAIAGEGYTFDKWTEKTTGKVLSNQFIYAFNVSTNIEIIANFIASSNATVEIAAQSGDVSKGKVTGQGSFKVNDEVILLATPEAGFIFEKWTENGSEVSKSASYTFTATQNRALVAQFKLPDAGSQTAPVSGISSDVRHGLSVGSGAYVVDTMATLVAMPEHNYQFKKWVLVEPDNDEIELDDPAAPKLKDIDDNELDFSASSGALKKNRMLSFKVSTQFTTGGDLVDYKFKAIFDADGDWFVNLAANDEDMGTVVGGKKYSDKAIAVISAGAKPGHLFVNWTDDDNSNAEFSVLPVAMINSVGKEYNLTANFVKSWNINVTATPGGTISGGGEVKNGDLVAIKATPSGSDFIFAGWYDVTGGASIALPDDKNGKPFTSLAYEFDATKDIDIEAKFISAADLTVTKYCISDTQKLYGDITYESYNSGYTYPIGEIAKITATPKIGFTLDHWEMFDMRDPENPAKIGTNINTEVGAIGDNIYSYKDENGTFKIQIKIPYDVKIVAAFQTTFYSVEVYVPRREQPVPEDPENPEPPLAELGTIAQWVEDVEDPEKSGFINPKDRFYKDDVDVDWREGRYKAIPVDGASKFVAWEENGKVISRNAELMVKVTGNRSIQARFITTGENVVSLIADTGGTFAKATPENPNPTPIIRTDTAYAENSNIILEAFALDGYRFDSWYNIIPPELNTDGEIIKPAEERQVSDVPKFPLKVDENTAGVYKATFIKRWKLEGKEITDGIASSQGGQITGFENGNERLQVFDVGKSSILMAIPNNGYRFIGWYNSVTGEPLSQYMEPSHFFTMNADYQVEARFKSQTNVTLSASPSNAGNATIITPALVTGKYDKGDSIELRAVPTGDYMLSGWKVNGVSKDISEGTVMDGYPSGAGTLVLELNDAAVINNTTNIIAEFSLPTSNVEVKSNDALLGNETVTQDGTSVSLDSNHKFVATGGKEIVVKASPEANSRLSHWVVKEYKDNTSGILTNRYDSVGTVGRFTTSVDEVTGVGTIKFKAFRDVSIEAVYKGVDPSSDVSIIAMSSDITKGQVTGSGTYTRNNQVLLLGTPSTGMRFADWLIDGVKLSNLAPLAQAKYTSSMIGSTARLIFDADTNITVTSVFVDINKISIKTVGGTNGTASQSGSGGYNAGEEVWIEATPKADYKFVRWMENGVEPNDFDAKKNPVKIVAELGKDRIIKPEFIKVIDVKLTVDTVGNGGTPGGSAYITGSGPFDGNSKVTLIAATNPGYKFKGWTDLDNASRDIGNDIKVEIDVTDNSNGEMKIQANFIKVWQLNTVAEGENKGTVTQGGLYESGSEATVIATPNVSSGYLFDSWSIKENGTSTSSTENPLKRSITKDSTIIANFKHSDYVVNATSTKDDKEIEEGAIVAAINGVEKALPAAVKYGDRVVLTQTPKKGYEFVKWTENGLDLVGGKDTFSFTAVGTHDIKAHYKLISYSREELATKLGMGVNLNAADDETMSAGVISIRDGEFIGTSATVNQPYKFGDTIYIHITGRNAGAHDFIGWKVNGKLLPNSDINLVDGGAVYKYSVGEPAPIGEFVNAGQSLVSIESRLVDGGDVKTGGAAGTVTKGGMYGNNQAIALTAVEKSGYIFEGWEIRNSIGDKVDLLPGPSADLSADGKTYSFTTSTSGLLRSRTVVAKFKKEDYKFKLSQPINGEFAIAINGKQRSINYLGSEAEIAVNYADSIQILATPKQDTAAEKYYKFDTWTSTNGTFPDSENLDKSPLEFTVDNQINNVIIGANFTTIATPAIVEFMQESGGLVEGEGLLQEASKYVGVFNVGDEIVVRARADANYKFAYWCDKDNNLIADTDPNNPELHINAVAGTRKIKAVFTEISKAVISILPSEGGTVFGGRSYSVGSEGTLVAQPETGYRFKNWTNTGGTEVSKNAVYTFAVANDRTLKANFVPIYKLNSEAVITPGGASGGGILAGDGSDGWYEKNDTAIMVVNPNKGYELVSWEITENGEEMLSIKPDGSNVPAGRTGEISPSVDSTTAVATLNFTMKKNTSIKAVMTKTESKKISVLIDPDSQRGTVNGDTVSGTGGNVKGIGLFEAGTTVQLVATASNKYRFVTWVDLDGKQIQTPTNPNLTFVAKENRNIMARFALATGASVSVQIMPASSGTVTGVNFDKIPTDAGYGLLPQNYGWKSFADLSPVTLVATANFDNRFSHWTENPNSTASTSNNSTYAFRASGSKDRHLYAVFVPTVSGFSAKAAIGGSASMSYPTNEDGSFDVGTAVSYSAIPEEGYEFKAWTNEDGGVVAMGNPYTVLAEGEIERTLIAKFGEIQKEYRVIPNATAGGRVTRIEGVLNKIAMEGATVTLEAKANQGYRFTGWTIDGKTQSKGYRLVFKATEDVAPLANFVPIQIVTPKLKTSTSIKSKYRKVTIVWSKATGAKEYELLRATSKVGKYKKIATVKAGKTLKYQDNKLAKNKYYYYKIKVVCETDKHQTYRYGIISRIRTRK